MGKKQEVIDEIFKLCKMKDDYIFHNELVKDISKKIKFGNPFDITKIDCKEKLPDILRDNDYGLIHLGNGYHKFVKGINNLYHNLEPIEKIIQWDYKKSLLNKFNASESNMLSIANNQRILHHFVFGEDTINLDFTTLPVEKRPKTYFPHRTKQNFEYNFNNKKVILSSIQIEIDLTIEYNGNVAVFEAKKNNTNNFSIYQLFHLFLYYYHAKNIDNINNKIKNIYCIFIKQNKNDEISMWKYTFTNYNELNSIKFLNSSLYKLIEK